MTNNPTLGKRWDGYRPSKAIWIWSCAACVVATIVIGFSWGGWVTGGTATGMASDAADAARTQLAAAACVNRFAAGPDANAQLAALKTTVGSERGELLRKNGWATMPGSKDPVAGAADSCAQQLVNTGLPAAKG